MYYVFYKRKSFLKCGSKSMALSVAETKGPDSVIFRRIPGIPNPWWVFRILPDGSYERDIDLDKKEYANEDLDTFLRNHFRS